MASSYTDLSIYRQCPRLFGFQKLGYRSAIINEPMTTGSLVHFALAQYFKGQAQGKQISNMMFEKVELETERLEKLTPEQKHDAEKVLEYSWKRATELANRYVSHWAKDYKATLIEPEIELDGVVCHPALLAFYQDKRVIVDYKTSYHPDDRWYDISNQTDLCAYVIQQRQRRITASVLGDATPELIIYDIISEKGIYRHMRPPRLAAGSRLFRAVQGLEALVTNIDWNNQDFQQFLIMLDNPHPVYTCPSRCDFFGACFILETDTWESCKDFLEENFLHE